MSQSESSHTPQPKYIFEQRPVAFDGPPCRNCGTIMVRSGSCHTCPDCGETGGCG